MNDFLYYLTAIFNLAFLVLVVTFFLNIKVYRRYKSLSITLVGVLIFELVFLCMRINFMDLPFGRETVRFTWFNGFSIVAMVGAYFIYKVHVMYKCVPKAEAKLVVTCYLFFSFFELITYVDYSFIETGLLPPVYQTLTPSIGLFVTIKLCWKTLTVIRESMQEAKLQATKQEAR